MKKYFYKKGIYRFPLFISLFFAGNLTAQNSYTASLCSAPVTAPSTLVLTPYSNNITGTFLPAIPAAAGYLVIRTTTSTPPSAPSDGTFYTAGSTALGGYIESVGVSTAFTSTALLPAASYWYWVIPYNTALTCAPVSYFNTQTLSSTVNTLTCGTLTNTLTLPETGNIAWTALVWSLGHLPTECEDVRVVCTGILPVNTTVTLNINTNVSLRNLSLVNNSTAPGNDKIFKINVLAGAHLDISGDLSIEGGASRPGDSVVFASPGNTTVAGNAVIGLPADNSFVSIGSSGRSSNQTIIFKGNVTYNQKASVSDKNTVVVMAGNGAQSLINNTSYAATGKLLLYDELKIGDGTNTPTVTISGSNANTYLNNNGGSVHIYAGATLVLPAGYTLNADNTGAGYNSSAVIDNNGSLKLAGNSGGYSGNNFPAHYTADILDDGSVVEYNGSNAVTQTIYNGIDYGKLVLSNGSGTGRAAKISTGGVLVNTSVTVEALTDLNAGSSIICNGAFDVISTAGLYCGPNVVSGTGAFTLSGGAWLGIGHAQGITAGSFSTGNIQMTGGRTFSTAANYIYNGASAQITGNGLPATCNDLTIDNPSSVTVSAAENINGTHYLLQGIYDIGTTQEVVNAGFTVTAGKMKANRGTLEFRSAGGSAQNISGSWFVNRNISTLINSNTTGITLSSTADDTLNISSALLFGASVSGSVIATNNNLTFLSRDTSTARLGEISGGNSITGNVTVERYIGSGRKWNQLSWPTVSAQTAFGSWMESSSANADNHSGYGLIITDAGAAWNSYGFDSRSLSGPSVKYYNPSANNYTGIPNTGSYAMNSQSAYFVFVRGDRSCTASNSNLTPTILRATGAVQTGDRTFNTDANVFTAIGNPYPSAVDMRALDTVNLAGSFYVWDPKLTGIWGLGGFQTFYPAGSTYKIIPGGGSYGAGGSFADTLESGQAFFVRSKGTPGSVTFKENAKTNGMRNMSREASVTPGIFALLSLADPAGNVLMDGVMASFEQSGNNNVDYDDALKMTNTSENVSLKRSGRLIAVERRKDLLEDDTLFLNVSGYRQAQYQWEIRTENMPAGLTAFLIDNYSGTTTALDLNNANSILFNVTGAAGTSAANRFMILLKPAAVLPLRFMSVAALRNADKTITVKWNTGQEVNIRHYEVERSGDGTRFYVQGARWLPAGSATNGAYDFIDNSPLFTDNYYRVKALNNDGTFQYSNIVKVSSAASTPTMSVYPNPAVGGLISLHFEAEPKGNYAITVSDETGRVIYAETLHNEDEHVVHTINLAEKAKPGAYNVSIICEGKKISIPFMMQQ